MYSGSRDWGIGSESKGYNPRTRQYEAGYDPDEDPLVEDSTLSNLIKEELPDYFIDATMMSLSKSLKLFGQIFQKAGTDPQQYTYLHGLQKLLEAIQMPVPNPKSEGEMDYIDFSLLDRTIIEPEYLVNLVTGKREKVELSLIAANGNTHVVLNAKFPDKSATGADIQTDQLESTLSDIVHNNQSMRLESTDLFRGLIDELIDRHVEASSDVLVHAGKTVQITDGLGIVMDTKADQEIGTFERVTIQTSKDKNVVTGILNDLLAILRPLSDMMTENDRYVFTYYDLAKNRQINFVAPSNMTSETSPVADATLVMASGFSVEVLQGVPDEKADQIRMESVCLKAITGQSKDNPVYTEEFDSYRESRSRIVRNSRESATKQKMVQQFSDIEL